MICKICNATIADNETKCPFCGSPVTMDVDPNAAPAFPDPAAPSVNASTETPVNPTPAPSAEPVNPTSDLGLSQPAQPYSDPMANQNPQPNPYTQNPNAYSQPNNYGVPNNGSAQYGYQGPDVSQELEKKAGTVQTLGIVGLVLAIVIGFCCCTLLGPICGIVGLVKANGLKGDMYLLSEEGQKKVNLGKILCIIAIVLGVLGIAVNALFLSTGMLEDMMSEIG